MAPKFRSLFKKIPSPKVVTLEGVEIVSVGEHPTVVGPGTITRDTLDALVAGEAIYGSGPLKVGHFDKKGKLYDGNPAYGWVQNLRVEQRTNKKGETVDTLVGDYAGVPEKFAGLLVSEADEDGTVTRRSPYPNRSAEILWDVPLPDDPDNTHPAMLRAVAVLGETNPADGGLNEVLDVFYPDDEDAAEELLTAPAAREGKATTLLATVNLDDIRKAYREQYPNAGDDYSYVREVWLDTAADGTAGFLIVEKDGQDELERRPWSVDDEGGVVFGDPEQVKVVYTAASAAGDQPQVLLAGRLDDKPAGGTVSGTTPKEGDKVDREKVLAKLRAAGHKVADDATDEQLLELMGTPAPKAEGDDEGTKPPEGEQPKPEETPTTTPPSAEVLAKAIQDGTVVAVSKEVWEDTQNTVKELKDKADEDAKAKDEALLETALSAGKILPAERTHYETVLASKDPKVRESAVTLLSTLEPGRVPVEERGNDHNPDSPGDDVVAQLWPEDTKQGGAE